MKFTFRKCFWGGAVHNTDCRVVAGSKASGRMRRGLAAFTLAAVVSLACLTTPAAAGPLEDAASFFGGVGENIASFFGIAPQDAGDISKGTVDASTGNAYTDSLGGDLNTAANGRVWTDKSVYTDDVTYSGDIDNGNNQGGAKSEKITADKSKGEEFLVSYSALATSQQITGKANVPVDVVFVIDNSNSMDSDVDGGGRQTRLQATVDAVNASIKKLMDSNPNSRVAVVLYGNSASTLLPLGHYEPMASGNYRGKYIGCNYRKDNTFQASGNHRVSMDKNIRGTNIHMGIDAGMDILATAKNTTTTIGGKEIANAPTLILLSDGAASAAGSGDWWNPNGRDGDGTGSSARFDLKAIMNAAYMKKQVDLHYGLSDDAQYHTQVYTIGMGVSQLGEADRNHAQIVLNPGAHLNDNNNVSNAIRNAWDQYVNGRDMWFGGKDYTPELSGYEFEHPQSDDINYEGGLNYNDDYLTADNAEDVTDAFDKITIAITTSLPQVPTDIGTGHDPSNDGYITYTDPIGEYMEVKDLKEIIYAGHVFTAKNKDYSGPGDYTFEGEVDRPVYGKKSLADIKITVTESADGNQTLTVKIPASVIPLRVNQVELKSDGTVENHSVTEQYPMRFVYSVGFQDEVLKDDGNGNKTVDFTKIDAAYADKHRDAKTGQVWFYSNKYSGEKADGAEDKNATRGDAYVEFKPSPTNPFYFVSENVPLYTSESADAPATGEWDPNAIYYYQVSYYKGEMLETIWRSRKGSELAQESGDKLEGVTEVDGQWNIAAGTPRLANLSQFDVVKGDDNATDTASTVYHPTFVGESGEISEGVFKVFLGNNGRVGVEEPGTLAVSKTATIAEGFDGPMDADGKTSTLASQEFTFTLSLKGENNAWITKEHRAVLYKGGKPVEGQQELKVKDGSTFTLKTGETLYIYDLDADTNYTVTESGMPTGFHQTKPADSKAASGAIEGGKTAKAEFENEYRAEAGEQSKATFKLQKVFDAWDNNPGISFDFWLMDTTTNQDAPFPAGAEVKTFEPSSGDHAGQTMRYISSTVSDGNEHDFGEITFDKKGTYTYSIFERTPGDDADKPIGVDYSNEAYTVTVAVADNGKGQLVATATMVKSAGANAGNAKVDVAKITNTYNLDNTHAQILGVKSYADTTGGNPLTAGKFTFYMKPTSSNAPKVYASSEDNAAEVEKNGDGAYVFKNGDDAQIDFGSIRLTKDDANKTYVYEIWEDVPAGAVRDDATHTAMLDGMTYDTHHYFAHVTAVPSEKDNKEGLEAKVVFREGADEDSAEVKFEENKPLFKNTYAADPAVVGGDAQTQLKVTKTVTGRDWLGGESFGFTMAPAEDDSVTGSTSNEVSTKDAIDSKKWVEVADGALKATVTSPSDTVNQKDKAYGASFGKITFKHAGTYTFNVTEDAFAEGEHASMTHDGDTWQVKVTVTDNGAGKLSVAGVTYANVTDDTKATDAAAFTNAYTAKLEYASGQGPLNVVKNLTGRGMKAEEFTFTVEGADQPSKEKLNGATLELKNHAHAMGSDGNTATCTMNALSSLKFDQDDVGKTFTYTVDEAKGTAPGVTYDENEYTVSILVTDPNRDGKLSTTITVTNTKDANDTKTFENGARATVTFDNAYKAKSTTLDTKEKASFSKTLIGRDWGENETFSFTLARPDGSNYPLPAGEGIVRSEDGNSVAATVHNAEEGKSFGFGTFTFTHEDMAGATVSGNGTKTKTFTYTVTEDAPEQNADGMTYDRHSYELNITVTDDGSGQLTAAVTSAAPGRNFENKYETSIEFGDTESALNIEKVLEGHAITEGQFDFEAKAADEDSASKFNLSKDDFESITSDNVKLPAAAEKNGTATSTLTWLTGLTFNQSDAGNTYSIIVKETVPQGGSAATAKDGYTYDTAEKRIDFVVTDDGAGNLTVAVKQDGKTLATFTNAEGSEKNAAVVTFTNSYQASGKLTGKTELAGAKTIDGPWPEGKSLKDLFEFTIEQVDEDGNASDAPAKAELPASAKTGEDGNFSFGDITFHEDGTYYFKVSEVKPQGENSNKVPGIDYTAKPVIIKVVVTDNGDGTLTAEKAADAPKLEFENTYATTENATYTPQVKKQVTGRDSNKGQDFSFTLTADEDTAKLIGNGLTSDVLTAQDANETKTTEGIIAEGKGENDGQTVDFSGMTFTKAGTYTFTVREADKAANEWPGWTYDTASRTLTVVVKDVDSKLQIDADKTGWAMTDSGKGTDGVFVNKYAVPTGTTVEVMPAVEKFVTGRDSNADFSFTMKLTSDNAENVGGLDKDGAVTATVAGKGGQIENGGTTPGTANFGKLTFKAEGDYIFEVTETTPAKGWTDSSTPEQRKTHSVTFHVSDNGEGGYSVTNSVTGDEPFAAQFTNKYDASMTEDAKTATNFSLTKVLKGRDWLKGDSFTFKLEAKGGAPLPKDAQGKDVTTATVTPVSKDVEGWTGKGHAKSFSFGRIEYTLDMLGGATSKDFVYTVTEEGGSIAGITYSKNTATVTVTVTDNGDGTLSATAKTENGTFTNTYKSSLDYSALGGLTITKKLTGRPMMADRFEFTMKYTGQGEDPLGLSGTYKSPAAVDGEVATVAKLGSGVTFDQDDDGNTYEYTVTESKKGGDGYTNDGTTYTVTIAVKDNEDGTITVTTTVAGKGDPKVYTYTSTAAKAGEQGAVVPFENSYETDSGYLGGEGAAQLYATKTLTGRDMVAGEFEFTVTNQKDASDTPVATGTNAAAGDGKAGKITFTTIEYTSKGLLKDVADGLATASQPDESGGITYTYTYDIAETKGTGEGVADKTGKRSATVQVTDNNNGTLTVRVLGAGSSANDALAFQNVYGEDATDTIEANGQKVLEMPEGEGYKKPNIAGQFTFTLSGKDEQGNPAPLPDKTSVTNDASGNVDFGAIEYTMDNVFGAEAETAEAKGEEAANEADAGVEAAKSEVRTKTFTYTVTESGSVEGVLNDASTSKTFTVTVTDNGDGTITAKTDPDTGFKFSFTNVYKVEPTDSSVTDDITMAKELTGRDQKDGEFAFQLVDEDGQVVATATNKADGSIAFPKLTYTKPGTHTYTVSEKPGSAGGVTYDPAVYTVLTTVEDIGGGKLRVSHKLQTAAGDDAKAIAFKNSYDAADTSVQISAAKVLTGRKLKDGEFTFELRYQSAKGEEVVKAKNKADGSIEFPVIPLVEEGDFDFTISEVKGDDSTITYDGTVYKATVHVTDPGDGQLKAELAYEGGKAPVFKNAYTEPKKPVTPEGGKDDGSGLPQTSDSSLPVGALAVMAAAGAALVGAGVVLVKRHGC